MATAEAGEVDLTTAEAGAKALPVLVPEWQESEKKQMPTILLLTASNLFMTIAWYWHLRFGMSKPLLLVIAVSWGIALVEYCLAVEEGSCGAWSWIRRFVACGRGFHDGRWRGASARRDCGVAGPGTLGGVFPGHPLQAAMPHALVEPGIELDWSHKSGKGREVRLFVTLRDEGERPERLQSMAAAAEAAVEALPPELDGWRIASLQFVRSRTATETKPRERIPTWATAIEYRARLLASG